MSARRISNTLFAIRYSQGTSRSSDSPCCWGETPDGRFIMCVYDEIDELTLLPVTAYEVPRLGERHV